MNELHFVILFLQCCVGGHSLSVFMNAERANSFTERAHMHYHTGKLRLQHTQRECDVIFCYNTTSLHSTLLFAA